MPPLYWLMKFVLWGPLVHSVYRPVVQGAENVPAAGPVIFACNHLSFMDSMFLPIEVDRHVVYLAKSEYFTGRGIKGWFSRMFFGGVGQVPIDRSGGKASEASLTTGLGVLAQGRQLGIYPEGTRSPDGRLHRGRTGVARLALESGAPLVPVAMIDTDKVLRKGSIMPRVYRIGVAFGEPMDFSRFQGMADDRFVLRSITDEIMHEIARLGGQEYVDVYAGSARARTAAPVRRKA